MLSRLFAVPLMLVLAAGLLGAGLPPELASAHQETPPQPGAETPPARLMVDGLLDAPRLSPAEDADAQDALQVMLAPEYAGWSRLVFQTARNGKDWEVYGAAGDGSGQVNLSNNPSTDVHPRLNRGATRVVFASKRTGNYDVFAMNADGSGQTRLTTSGKDDVSPAWSSDGSRIAFQAYRDGQAEIYVMNADGTGQKRLTNTSDYDGQPVWSPEGSQIAFVRKSSGQYRVWVMNADGSNAHQLSNQAISENPAWSPDGSQIAYDADGNGDGWQELWLMDAAGGNQRVVYQPGESNTDAWARSWSPDGRYVAFTRISWTYYQNDWYWTTAYLDAWDSRNTGNVMRLSGNGADWYPDWQTTDPQAPTSNVLPLPAQSPGLFYVHWTGSDAGPSGLASYDVQTRDGIDGAWTDYAMATTDTVWTYAGVGGHTYYFRSRARDNAGNLEAWPADYDAVTTVESLPPITVIQPLPALTRGENALIQWDGSDPGDSGIVFYFVQMRQGNGAWADWHVATSAGSAVFNGTAGATYGFRVRGVDYAHNLEDWPTNAEAETMLYSWAIMGNVTDNRGAPVTGVTVTTTPDSFHATSSDINGDYAVFVAGQAADYTVNWSKPAYGALPETAFPTSIADAEWDVVMPPADNVVQNWGFENNTSAWQFGGSLNGMITSADNHSGTSAASLGSEAKPLQSITTLAGPLRTWDPPMDSAMDSDGTIHVVWIELDGRIMYSRKPPAGTWTVPIPLPGPVAHGGGSVKLFVDSAGTIHVVWVSTDALYYSQNQARGGWSTPERIPETTSTWEEPGLAVSATGVVKVVFVGTGVSGIGYGDAYFTQRNTNGTWTPPRNISDTYGPDERFTVATDPSGLAHVLWYGFDDPRTATQQAFYAAETSYGSWLPATNLSQHDSHIGDADMVIDGQGTAHVVWSAYAVFYRTRPEGGSWSPKELIASTTGGVSLFVDERDRVHLAWGDSVSSQVRYAVRPNGVWSGAVSVAPPTGTPSQSSPDLVIDENDTVHVLWLQYQDMNDWTIRYSAQNAVGEWLPPVDVFQNDHDTAMPQLLVDSSGTPHAIWGAYAGGYSILYAGPGLAQTGSEASMSQVVQVPDAAVAPTLSFWYRFGSDFPSDSRLEVVIDDGISPTTEFSVTSGTGAWKHQWTDLTPWAGRSVTLRFKVTEAAGGARAWAYIDEVTVGSAHPDTWVRVAGQRAAPPGGQLTQDLRYGNRGGVAASNGYVTLQLPPELTFVSADPAPSMTSPELRWDVGDLAGPSDPGAIHVTLQVAPAAAPFTTVMTTVTIASDTAEIEQVNNTAQATLFIGYMAYLPVVWR